jgi:hypothetical protein
MSKVSFVADREIAYLKSEFVRHLGYLIGTLYYYYYYYYYYYLNPNCAVGILS